jgi:glycosyltransferase involved in cell wall biosynthesis
MASPDVLRLQLRLIDIYGDSYMRLSFVVPAYNEEAYLPACLESILAQTRELGDAVEIIVVNNASTDRTREVALGYPGVRVVDEMRKGLTFARQAGFAASTGELIANVDSDSRLTPGWVKRCWLRLPASQRLVSLSGPFIYYDLSPTQRISVQVFYAIAFMVYVLNRWVLRAGSMVQGGNFVLRREALEQIGGFDTAISFYGEDTDIARRMSQVGKCGLRLG